MVEIFDNEFYQHVMGRKLQLEHKVLKNIFPHLNCQITLDKVNNIINKTKRNKSVSMEGIAYEVMENYLSAELLSKLFSKIFDIGLIPSMWRQGIIKPIPKGSLLDP